LLIVNQSYSDSYLNKFAINWDRTIHGALFVTGTIQTTNYVYACITMLPKLGLKYDGKRCKGYAANPSLYYARYFLPYFVAKQINIEGAIEGPGGGFTNSFIANIVLWSWCTKKG